MTGSEDSVGVVVPASSANLGPGYDSLAVAVDRTLTVWTEDAGEARVRTSGLGAEELPTDDTSLIWRAFASYCGWAGVPTPDVALAAHNDIPLERGLGSSAAAAVAGLALARAVTDAAGADRDLVELAVGLEGHPENAAAAVHGGLVVCHDGLVTRLEPAADLRPVLCVPDTRQSTNAARGLLPDVVPLSDAAANAGRAAAVLAGLAGLTAWEPRAMVDALHEPSRLDVMPATAELVHGVRASGIGACLSGAGPSVLCVVNAGDSRAVEAVTALTPAGWQVWPTSWHRAGAVVCPPSASVTGAERGEGT